LTTGHQLGHHIQGVEPHRWTATELTQWESFTKVIVTAVYIYMIYDIYDI
jgi:hypothetical protein